MTKKDKKYGQVFTPFYIVNNILDLCDYKVNNNILKKHIIDNSCGDGAFLSEIVNRYCLSYINKNKGNTSLKEELETYIHGIDIDNEVIQNCITNLNNICAKYNIFNVKWDIFCGNTLKENKFNGKMDYVIGNPPYIRIHNLSNQYTEVKNYKFTQNGMVDMYITFFEIGINMLNDYGKLCYITPSSWTTSKTGLEMRKWFKEQKIIKSIVDLEHYNVFENHSVYTMITLLDKTHLKDNFNFYNFNNISKTINFIEELNINDIDINNEFFFINSNDLQNLKEIKTNYYNKDIIVKNGIATLLDNVFINDNLPFENFKVDTLKASTGKWTKCFFPYNIDGTPIEPNIIYNNDDVINYLTPYKEKLLKRNTDKNIKDWFYFGRSQGLKDVNKERLGINNIIKDINSIKINTVPIGCLIYSGLYIYSEKYDLKIIEGILKTEDFIKYIKSLKKYKNGGFYTFSSKDIESYINFKIKNN